MIIKNKYTIFLFVGITISHNFVAMDSSEEEKIRDEFNTVHSSMKKEISIALQHGYDKGYYFGLRNGKKDHCALPQATIPQAKKVLEVDQSESLPAIVNSVTDEDVYRMDFVKVYEAGAQAGFLFGAGLASFIVYQCMKK